MIGIDIGTKYIKFASLDKKGQDFHLRSAIMCPTPPPDSSSKQDVVLSARLKSIVRDHFQYTKRAAASVGGCQIVARNFELAALGAEEMEGAVMLEARQSVSADLNSMYSDFQILANLEKEKKDILFAAVPSQVVDKQVQIVENSGLNIELVDIDNLAAANCYIALDKNVQSQSVVLLNVGHSFTNIAIIDSGALRFIRNVSFGGSSISAEMAGIYGVPPEAAEELKKREDLWKGIGFSAKNVLRKTMPDLLEAVYRSMEYCMNRKKILNIDKILITGGTSNLGGIESFIADALGIVAEKWNPLDHLAADDILKRELGGCFSVALGLAVREWQKS